MQVEVLHVIGSFIAGGAECFVVNLIRALKKEGLSVGVLALSSIKDKVGRGMLKSLEMEGIPYFIGPTDRVRYRSAIWYTKKLFEICPSIVHLHTANTELAHYLGTKVYRKRHLLVRTLHSTNVLPNKWYWKAIHENKVNLSIACSRAVKNTFELEVNGNIQIIQNGVEFSWPVQTKSLRDYYKKKLGMDLEKYHFLNIGRQSGVSLEVAPKAHDVLIKAWKRGRLSSLGSELHLIGDGNLSNDLKELAKGDVGIYFHGVKDNIPEWLLAADCYVMPSRHEGLPIAGIEAVGTGLPSIFSNIKPLRELEAPVVSWVPVNCVEVLSDRLSDAVGSKDDRVVGYTSDIRTKFGLLRAVTLYKNVYSSIRS